MSTAALRLLGPRLILGTVSLLLACGEKAPSNGTPGNGGSGNGGRPAGNGGAPASGQGGSGSGSGGSVAPGNGGVPGGTGGASGTGGGGMTGGTPDGGPGDSGSGTPDTGAMASCGWSGTYNGPLLGRCDPASCTDGKCGVYVSKGGFLTLDDFEGTPTTTGQIGINWPARDGRTGSWQQYPTTNKLEVVATDTAGGSPGSKQAMHFSGAATASGATLALPMGSSCYDASAYDGVSFWVKGNPAAGNTRIKFNLHTPVTEPKESGGACTQNCYDHFAKSVEVTTTWTQHKIKWSDFVKEACRKPVPAIPDGYNPHKMILAVSFSATDPMKGFDFWVDDIRLDAGTRKRDSFETIMTAATFNEMFKTPMAPASYTGLVDAVKKYGTKWAPFASEGTDYQRQNEVAALFGHIRQETGELTQLVEKVPTMPPYHGRGAIQITGIANYQAAEAAGFTGIVATPDRVVQSADYLFGTALWFWNTARSAKGVCHAQIMGGSFSRTTWIINGGVECRVPLPPQQVGRISHYRQMAAALGINPVSDVECRAN